MRWPIRLAWALGGAVLLLGLTGGLGLTWLGTASGTRWLETKFNDLAAGRARIGALDGNLPFRLAAEQIELLDSDGVWMTLRGVRADIAPGDLLRRRLTFTGLAAEAIDMHRSPAPAEPSSETSSAVF